MSHSHSLPIEQQQLATEVLSAFEHIHEAAKNKKKELERLTPASSLASVNTLTYQSTLAKHGDAIRETLLDCEKLIHEPAIIRVATIDENDVEQTYFICRGTPPTYIDPSIMAASYRAPIGSLASIRVGEALEILKHGKRTEITVTERLELHPQSAKNGWDSIDSLLQVGDQEFTITSLREFLKNAPEIDMSLLEEMLSGGDQLNIKAGKARPIIRQLALRDRPILDKLQDKIFRLPLTSQLFLVGPPGTGKTTTLIKRLGMKLDTQYLTKDEQNALPNDSRGKNWIMFTPTELLKLYVQNAFAIEGIPASDQHLHTWNDYRHTLASYLCKFIGPPSHKRGFIFRGAQPAPFSSKEQIHFYEEFQSKLNQATLAKLKNSAHFLSTSSEPDLKRISNKALKSLSNIKKESIETALMSLAIHSEELQKMKRTLDEKNKKILIEAGNLQVNRNKLFLNELLDQFPLNIADNFAPDEFDDVDEDDTQQTSSNDLKKAFNIYSRAIRAYSLALVTEKELGKKTKNKKIIEWLKDRMPTEKQCRVLGQNALTLSHIKMLATPIKQYFIDIPNQYKQFKKDIPEKNLPTFCATETKELTAPEVDILLLCHLRTANLILSKHNVTSRLDESFFSILSNYYDYSNIQVMVDEATDFSPVQLACMAALSHPSTNSFFACGDYNQRITSWGTQTEQDLRWALPKIACQKLEAPYRQSKSLLHFLNRIFSTEHSLQIDSTEQREHPPVLKLGLSTPLDTADWLAKRIVEISNELPMLPSIAVLVASESEVEPIAKELTNTLAIHSIQVMACRNGEVKGHEQKVRVFSIEHIKGMEFEAVFFIGIDSIAAANPSVYSKYLYVGATRAATYLGLTCTSSSLPSNLAPYQSDFADQWNNIETL